jgi:hypothetical protein
MLEKTHIHDHCRDAHLAGSMCHPEKSYFLHLPYIEETSRPHYLDKVAEYLAQYSDTTRQQGLGVCVDKGVITPQEARGRFGWTGAIVISSDDEAQDHAPDKVEMGQGAPDKVEMGQGAPDKVEMREWACGTCTFINKPLHLACDMCQERKTTKRVHI